MTRRAAAAVGCAVAAAAGVAACGLSDAEVTARADAICASQAVTLRPPPVPAGPGRLAHLEDVLSAYNLVDARLSRLDGRGATAGDVRGLRDALARVRQAFVSEYGIATRPPGEVRARPDDATAAFADLNSRARALQAPRCAAAEMGAPLYRAYAAAMVREARAVAPTGDFAADVGTACRALPASLDVPGRPSDPGRAQAWALKVRDALLEFARTVAATPAPPTATAAKRAVRDIVARDAELLAGYTESVRTSSWQDATQAARDHAENVARLRAALRPLGIRCP
ncbi:MAG: hypothetical protein KDC33_06600 [Thermoleophilia bacterium]|nr:hypothetical protein [Thermoleophilia bacterium]